MTIEVEWVQTEHLYPRITNSERSFYIFTDINIKVAVSHGFKEYEF